ncbi:MAG: chorismate synthase, partial [Bdellovibrionales bacterium]|nr:chorismate synthase [Bdellovibrionales bacterium]NQZ18019.1 chorismate synthase [Bdellovibrionales bacterium]
MGSNQFGHLFQFTSFGESHGSAMGVVIDGCPAGVTFDEELLLKNLARRRPGQKTESGESIVTARDEKDQPKVLSGVFEGKTLGTPIAVVVENQNQKSQDYDKVKKEPRVGHADDMWSGKFGHWDHRGGGRASARETLNWVIAGSVAQMICQQSFSKMKVTSQLLQVGPVCMEKDGEEALEKLLLKAKEEGESYGAVVSVTVENPPKYLGEPIFKKIKSELAHAYMGINACCGVELGGGFKMALEKGSEVHQKADSVVYGGIRGGM